MAMRIATFNILSGRSPDDDRVDEERELARIDEAARDVNARSGFRVGHRWPVIG